MATLTLTPLNANPGQMVSVKGSGFGSKRIVHVALDGTVIHNPRATSSGTFTSSVIAPQNGVHTVTATSTVGAASATLTVITVVVPPPSTTYTFEDNFDGTALKPVWQHNYHCCGSLVGYDSSLTTVANGKLSLSVEKRADGWHGDIIDTKNTFTQLYGYFEASITIPKGAGLWPAWWLYFGNFGGLTSEIDIMEVCANSIGANGGNDVTNLHTTVHFADNTQQYGVYKGAGDLSLAPHVYAVDWRADHLIFYLDGKEVWRLGDAYISKIPNAPLALLLNLGVGGSWCGAPDSTTPTRATMQVDWVRVRP